MPDLCFITNKLVPPIAIERMSIPLILQMSRKCNARHTKNLIPRHIIDTADYCALGNIETPEHFQDACPWNAFFGCATPDNLTVQLTNLVPEALICLLAPGRVLEKLRLQMIHTPGSKRMIRWMETPEFHIVKGHNHDSCAPRRENVPRRTTGRMPRRASGVKGIRPLNGTYIDGDGVCAGRANGASKRGEQTGQIR